MPGDEVSFGNPLSNAPGSADDYRGWYFPGLTHLTPLSGYIFRPRPKKAQSIDENAGGGVFAKYEIGCVCVAPFGVMLTHAKCTNWKRILRDCQESLRTEFGYTKGD